MLAAQTLTFVLILLFLGYLAMIVVAYLRQRHDVQGDPGELSWHFFVPCQDEEAVIAQTIRRLRADFPVARVWVIDDASRDGTAEVVERCASWDSKVRLVRRYEPNARTGKGDALNAAYHALDRSLAPVTDRSAVIVCVVDADGQLDPNALGYLAAANVFGDGAVGAAQVSVSMRNRNDPNPRPDRGRLANAFSRYLVRMQDVEFRTTIAAMQALRSKTRSVGLGGNGQFTRLSTLDEIARDAGEPWHGALLEDYELGVHVMLAGYEVKYVDSTYVSQEGLTDLRRLFTQRTRWAQGNIQCAKYLPKLVKCRHFSSAGLVEAGYYLLWPYVQLVAMLLWPVVLLALLTNSIGDAGSASAWLGTWWPLLVLWAAIGVVPFAIWGPIYKLRCERDASWARALGWGLGVWLYNYYLYVTTPRSFARVVRRRSGWAKTRRNAELRAARVEMVEAS